MVGLRGDAAVRAERERLDPPVAGGRMGPRGSGSQALERHPPQCAGKMLGREWIRGGHGGSGQLCGQSQPVGRTRRWGAPHIPWVTPHCQHLAVMHPAGQRVLRAPQHCRGGASHLIANGSTAATPTGCGKTGVGVCHVMSPKPVASEPWQPQPKSCEWNCRCGRDRASQGTQPPLPPPVHFWWQVVIVLLATRDQGSATTGEGVGRGSGTPMPPSCPDGFWSRAEPSTPALGQPSGYMTRARGQFGVQFLTMLSWLWDTRSWVCWGIPC